MENNELDLKKQYEEDNETYFQLTKELFDYTHKFLKEIHQHKQDKDFSFLKEDVYLQYQEDIFLKMHNPYHRFDIAEEKLRDYLLEDYGFDEPNYMIQFDFRDYYVDYGFELTLSESQVEDFESIQEMIKKLFDGDVADKFWKSSTGSCEGLYFHKELYV